MVAEVVLKGAVGDLDEEAAGAFDRERSGVARGDEAGLNAQSEQGQTVLQDVQLTGMSHSKGCSPP